MARKEHHDEELVNELAGHYREIIRLIGEDPSREGLLKTPIRAAKAMIDLTAGYRSNPMELAQKAIFEHEGSRVVCVKDIEFYSLCEHHLLPFFGRVSVGYIPKGKIVGLSKLARIVDNFARRLQVQERLTFQICSLVDEALPNDGVIVICEGEHLCMKMRGVEKQDSSTTTIEYTGRFASDYALREEFLRMIK